jgi:predicted dehydrogenase
MGKRSRREFLRDSAALSALLGGAPLWAIDEPKATKTEKKGEDNPLRIAQIGVRGQGRSHLKQIAGKHNCLVTVICDCDESDKVIGEPMKIVEQAQGSPPKFEKDVRKVVESKEIDAVSIATPNHWHALAAIWAMQNGKDVYVEKPVSHNVWEGWRLVEAARHYKRICQAGTQIRSQKGVRDAIAFLHAGKLGKVKVARGLCYKPRTSIGKVNGAGEVPSTVDYDLWCGPAPKAPPRREKFHYDWHWFWDYGNGDLGNQGIHQVDICRWGLGKNDLGKSVLSVGGRFGYIDDGETPNTQIAIFDYGDSELIFEVRGLATEPYKGARIGCIFHCEDGYLVIDSYSSGIAFDKNGEVIKKFKEPGDHFGNWVQAVRSRKVEDQHADILEGHLSSALCHLANISFRLGKDEPFDAAGKAFGDDKEAVETLARMAEHLKDNRVALDKEKYRVGRKLRIEPGQNLFVGDKEARSLLTREYRKGFEVPAQF